MRALGIDLSTWDLRPLDWQKASELLSFAFIKISEGTVPDPLFRPQWEAAEGYILRGLYHFFIPSVDPEASVKKTIEIYKAVSPGELPPALDLEVGDPKITLDRARAWLEIFERATGVRPIIYSSPGFLSSIGAGAKTASGKYLNEWLRSYEVWLSVWPYDNMSEAPRRDRIRQILRGDIVPAYPNGVPPWNIRPAFYQWTSRGEPGDIPGYYMGTGHKLAVDLNYYFGTKEELFSKYGKPHALPENGEETLYKYSITPRGSDGLKVRLDHYVVDSPIPNKIGSLAFARFAFGDERWTEGGEDWLKVVSVDGAAITGWIAAKHNGTQVGNITPLGDDGEEETGGDALEATVTVSSPGYKPQTVTLFLERE